MRSWTWTNKFVSLNEWMNECLHSSSCSFTRTFLITTTTRPRTNVEFYPNKLLMSCARGSSSTSGWVCEPNLLPVGLLLWTRTLRHVLSSPVASVSNRGWKETDCDADKPDPSASQQLVSLSGAKIPGWLLKSVISVGTWGIQSIDDATPCSFPHQSKTDLDNRWNANILFCVVQDDFIPAYKDRTSARKYKSTYANPCLQTSAALSAGL